MQLRLSLPEAFQACERLRRESSRDALMASQGNALAQFTAYTHEMYNK